MKINLNGTEYSVGVDTYDKIVELIRQEHPIRKYVKEHPTLTGTSISKVQIIKFKEHNLVVVPLPITNTEWTLAAFDYIRELTKLIPNDYYSGYPVHGPDKTPNLNSLYFMFED